MNAYQTATAKALKMIGMETSDMERTDFFKRSGVRAGKALRSMGYSCERFPTMNGRAKMLWAAPACSGEYRPPVSLDHVPAFNVLVAAIANDNGGNR